ncbi:hypothetical protein RGU72_05060 [Undibacterium sp. 5I1]|uniref:hypothetical protein n=1 Tax=unclassified Undibacterium TaxID=2630295 RepID=UPI002AB3E3BE|nr:MULTISPECIES: hypothetical protein [unclassified Undibacterium]MDY7537623.1 hypothetical protein [Undibacterium sp. 5I1]MEB0230168.1 hypothetical protein [Undibacterium sp. 10I3]MEB0256360.1 hypothetical protein [Undibacterium sp. 5I1]
MMVFPENESGAEVTLFDETGAVSGHATLSRSTFEHYAANNVSMSFGTLSADECYFKDGEVVQFTPAQKAIRLLKPFGFTWDASQFKWVDHRDIETTKRNKLSIINADCSLALERIKSSYPRGEVDSWSKQELEARNFIASSDAKTPLLSALAEAREIDMPTLCSKIIAKADAFASASGALIGERQRCESLINAATTNEEVDAIQMTTQA